MDVHLLSKTVFFFECNPPRTILLGHAAAQKQWHLVEKNIEIGEELPQKSSPVYKLGTSISSTVKTVCFLYSAWPTLLCGFAAALIHPAQKADSKMYSKLQFIARTRWTSLVFGFKPF